MEPVADKPPTPDCGPQQRDLLNYLNGAGFGRAFQGMVSRSRIGESEQGLIVYYSWKNRVYRLYEDRDTEPEYTRTDALALHDRTGELVDPLLRLHTHQITTRDDSSYYPSIADLSGAATAYAAVGGLIVATRQERLPVWLWQEPSPAATPRVLRAHRDWLGSTHRATEADLNELSSMLADAGLPNIRGTLSASSLHQDFISLLSASGLSIAERIIR